MRVLNHWNFIAHTFLPHFFSILFLSSIIIIVTLDV